MTVTPTSPDPPARIAQEIRPVSGGVDVPTFEAIVEAHHEPVRRMVRRLLGWSDDAEDVVQDVFTTVLEQLPRFRGESSLGTWIMGIAIRRCRYQQRVWRRAWRVLKDPRLRSAPPRREGGVGMEMEADETASAVREAVRSLRSADREVIVLYYLQEMSVKEVAEVLGVKPGAVEVRLHRARRRLRERLRGKGLGEDVELV